MWLVVWLAAVLWAVASFDDGDYPYTADEWRTYVTSSPGAPPRYSSNATSADFTLGAGASDTIAGANGAIASAIDDDKWFHEVHGHFDHRWYRSKPGYYANQNILWRLAAAWLEYADRHELDTWLAHGTLLGWYWNKLPLPWDNDIDAQITPASFTKLEAAHDTYFHWRHHRYYIDVNRRWRRRSGANNTIDARFIDTTTGMYVDITVLSLATTVPRYDLGELTEFDLVVDPELRDKLETMISGDNWRYQRDQLQGQLVHCKDNHYYTIDDILPLVPTHFCGVAAWVPRRYHQVLAREYRRGLRDTVYGSHNFHRQLRLWVKRRLCRWPGACHNAAILNVADITRNVTAPPIP